MIKVKERPSYIGEGNSNMRQNRLFCLMFENMVKTDGNDIECLHGS